MAAAAEHEQRRLLGALDEHIARVALDDVRSHLDARVVGLHLRDDLVEHLRALLRRVEVGFERHGVAVVGGPLPRREGLERLLRQLGVLRGPFEGAQRRRRSVDSDDDGLGRVVSHPRHLS